MRDAYRLTVSCDSCAAVDGYDRGVRALLGFGADSVAAFESRVAADPEFALARAGLAVSRYLNEELPAGRAEMARAVAAAKAPGLSARERRHVEALALWVGGRGDDAFSLMRDPLAEHPRDMMLLQPSATYLWPRRSAEMPELTESVRSAFDGDSYIGDGIASETAKSAEGRGNLVKRVKGDGALDMKSTGILQPGAVLATGWAKVPLTRDLLVRAESKPRRIHGNDERLFPAAAA